MGLTMKAITKYDDIIDSRDVIERIAELQAQIGKSDEDLTELEALVDLSDEAEGYTRDWAHGATLIRDSYFKTYAQELADDCGMIKEGDKWPYTCIDWEQAARELQMGYTSVEFDGVTYWVR